MTSRMKEEIDEIPAAAARLVEESAAAIEEIGAWLRARDPRLVVTIARGSSDHAAFFLKYATELTLGLPVASLGPSLASLYGARLRLDGAAALSVSQSGASPDIVAMTTSAREGGAATLALVNTVPSPLSDAAERRLDIAAGPEVAVAATKSFVNSILAGLAVLSAWGKDAELAAALRRMPRDLEAALALDWSALLEPLSGADSLYMLGRGPSLAIAAEAALKCKETCELHAEAYSSAEVLHGPVSLVDRDFPVIAFAARDRAEMSILATVDRLAAGNGHCFVSSAGAAKAHRLPVVATGHPLTDALALVVPYYRLVETLSRRRGYDPDRPAALKKVTETR